MKINAYKTMRDERVRGLYKNGAEMAEIRNLWGIDDELIRKICLNVVRINKPTYTQKKRKAEKKNDDV